MRNVWVLTSLLFSCLTLACQETKVETSKPSSAPSDKSADAQPSDEKVVAPVPINGVWLNAHVLREKSSNNEAEAQIGIASYHNGVKVTDQRDRFMVTLTATPIANNNVSILHETAPTGDYDHVVTIQGPSLDRVRSSYATIGVYVTIFDRNDNSTDTWNTTLDALLTEGSSKTVVSSSSSASASTNSKPKGP